MQQQSAARLQSVVAERLIEVADYQRPYAWEEKQLTDLWDDLDLLGSGQKHYAGTIVLKRLDRAPSSASDGVELDHFEVVDGQQRLITCFILLDRIRRALMQPNLQTLEGVAETAQRLDSTFRFVTVKGATLARLRLAPDLNTIWVDHVLGDHPVASTALIAAEKRLLDAATFFRGRLDTLVANVEPLVAAGRLLDLQRRVTSGLQFLVYEIESDAEVGVVFETLNDRGRPLSDLDKVKNYLLYLSRQLPDDRQSQLTQIVNERWSKIFINLAGLPSSSESQLLRAHWLATQDPEPRNWKGTASVKARFPRSRYVSAAVRLAQEGPGVDAGEELWQALFDTIDGYTRTLHLCSIFLSEMNNAAAKYEAFNSDQDLVRQRTAALMRSPVVYSFRPLLFAQRLAHPKDGESFAALLALCETYSARVFAICLKRTNAGESTLSRLAHRLIDGGDPSQCRNEIVALLLTYASDEEMREGLSDKHNWYNRDARKYFLYEYELSRTPAHDALRPFDDFQDTGKRKTTEHILPQNPEEDSQWWSAFDPGSHERLKNTLGNLVLTYDNSCYGRKAFLDKLGKPTQDPTKPCYATASLAQERELLAFDEWTPEAIEKRRQTLVNWAMKRWAVPAPQIALVEAVAELEDSCDPDDVDNGEPE